MLSSRVGHNGGSPSEQQAPPADGMVPAEEGELVAGFLLQLKQRSVTPEEADEARTLQRRIHLQSFSFDDSSTSMPRRRTSSESQRRTSAIHAAAAPQPPPQQPLEPIDINEIDWDILLKDSELIKKTDRELVPDSLLAAMAQLIPCQLIAADQVGSYKNREIGFRGMCCKHCAGAPGFGRYFPNSLRSLSQTTTSQTILKHMSYKCSFCPPEIRQIVSELQKQEAAREGLPTQQRPRYGSRKIFFQRLWTRLHSKDSLSGEQSESDESNNTGTTDGSTETSSEAVPPSTATSSDTEEAPSSKNNNQSDDEDNQDSKRRKVDS